MRKLASIQKIVDIQPISGADFIEKATILGWEVVVAKKDNFKVGDLVVYFEIDSILPDKPEYEFLRSVKFRIKTRKFKKQVSQGLVLPLSILPETNKYRGEGEDVSDLLQIKKFDPEGDKEEAVRQAQALNEKNKVRKFFMQYSWTRRVVDFFFPKERYNFPNWIHKTDEDRIQLFPDICQKYKGIIFTETEKADGQSLTTFVIKNNKKFLWFGEKYIFGVCSRNFRLKENDSTWWKIAKKLNLKEKMIEYADSFNLDTFVIQGEIIGPSIQGNKYKLDELELKVFNIFENGVSRSQVIQSEICQELELDTVPVLNFNFTLGDAIPQCVDMAKGNSVLNKTVLREGIIIRNYEMGLSFKIINPDFLLKNEE